MSLITFDNKVDSISNPAPRINKVIADDINDLKSGINYFYDAFGWESYADTVNTEGSPQVLTASVANQITIVDDTPNNAQKPIELGANGLWTGNKITPITSGDAYLVRFDFTASIDNVSGYFDLKIDIDGAVGVIFTKVNTFPKGANVAHGFTTTNFIFTGDTFKLNGGSLIITPSHEMEIWDKVVVIQRIYKAKPII